MRKKLSQDELIALLAVQKEKVLALSGLQRELRAAVLRLRKEAPKPPWKKLASKLRVSWQDLNKLVNRRQTLCGGKTLAKLTSGLERVDLVDRITIAASGLSSPLRGLAAFSPEVIELAFGVREEFVRTGRKGETHASFSKRFKPSDKLVLGLLIGAKQSLIACERSETRNRIRSLFSFNQVVRTKPSSSAAKAPEEPDFNTLYERLYAVHGSARAIARLLKCSTRTLTRVCKGLALPETKANLIARAMECLAGYLASPGLAAATVAKPTSGTSEKGLNDLLERHGGGRSPLGVKYVLGPDSFRAIKYEPGADLIAFVKSQIETLRGLLNLLAQIKNDQVRARVREGLSREIEELELALRSFTAEFPNLLTPLYEGQRQFWVQFLAVADSQQKKGAKS